MSRLPELETADLIRYVIGETTPAEATRVHQWLVESHDHLQLLNNVQRLVHAVRTRQALEQTDPSDAIAKAFAAHVARGKQGNVTAAMPSTPDAHVLQQRLLARGPALAKRGARSTVGRVVRRPGRRGFWSAATACAIIGIGVGVFRWSHTRPAQETTRSYSTGADQQAIVTLHDGTRVTLAPQTTLRLVRFGSPTRTVMLDGEAYFEVTRSAGAPFVVRSGTITTRVLGTAFLVRGSDRDHRAHVAVADGKVRVETRTAMRGAARIGTRVQPTTPWTLTSGHILDVGDSTVQSLSINDGTTDRSVNGYLVFRNTPISQVLATLSRWYGYQFRFADTSLASERVSFGLSTRSSAVALADLEQLLSVNLKVVGDTITLVPQLVHPPNGPRRIRTYDVWTAKREVGR